MAVTVYIPTPFRRYTENQSRVAAKGHTVLEVLQDLGTRYPGLGDRVFDANGEIQRYINIYVNSKEIDHLDGPATKVDDDDEVALIPAMAGGALPFTEEQIKRYSRHIILPQVGGRGQRKLLQSKVLLVGAGGLGSPVALYLTAAGVGKLGIVDFDEVDLSNLQRQLLHHTGDVGRLKVDSAADTIASLNPDVEVAKYPFPLNSENIMDVIADYDVVVDGSDNFPTRYLINDACVMAKKPNMHGSIFMFEGQATVFLPGQGCYRCLYPVPPPPGMVPSCQQAGVLGVLPGLIGIIQAIETIKLLLGLGESLAGRLILFDALSMEFRQVRLRKDPDCPVCGDHPTITQLIDYNEFCGVPSMVN